VALGPAIAAGISIPVLGEMPSSAEWFAIIGISVGVYLASGDLQPRRARAGTPH
jgi:drug/metabolite transporter (DMT)-like permease